VWVFALLMLVGSAGTALAYRKVNKPVPLLLKIMMAIAAVLTVVEVIYCFV
jgi:hypothetical protein